MLVFYYFYVLKKMVMKKKYSTVFLLCVLSLASINTFAQECNFENKLINEGLKIGEPNTNVVLLRESALNRINNRSVPCANIVVNYVGVDFFDIFDFAVEFILATSGAIF